jgi:hypothetical protein
MSKTTQRLETPHESGGNTGREKPHSGTDTAAATTNRYHLDENEIANILSSYLRSDPKDKPYKLSAADITALMQKATSSRNDVYAVQSVGCIFSLALSCASQPNFDESTAIELCLYLQSVAVECLIVMKLAINSIEFGNPSEIVDATDMEALGVYETFASCWEQAKDLLRDCTHQVRTSSELASKESDFAHNYARRNAVSDIKPAVDVFQAHSLYFMCALALCHMAIVVDYKHHINALPGIVEILVREQHGMFKNE